MKEKDCQVNVITGKLEAFANVFIILEPQKDYSQEPLLYPSSEFPDQEIRPFVGKLVKVNIRHSHILGITPIIKEGIQAKEQPPRLINRLLSKLVHRD